MAKTVFLAIRDKEGNCARAENAKRVFNSHGKEAIMLFTELLGADKKGVKEAGGAAVAAVAVIPPLVPAAVKGGCSGILAKPSKPLKYIFAEESAFPQGSFRAPRSPEGKTGGCMDDFVTKRWTWSKKACRTRVMLPSSSRLDVARWGRLMIVLRQTALEGRV